MISMNRLPAMVGIGHDAPPARAWTLLLIAAVGVSVYGNVAHARLTGHGWAAAAWFAVPPVALFWVTHLVAKTAGRTPSTAVKWLIWLGGIPAALAVAGMAFVVSFRALREWTLHQGGDGVSSILLPLIVDLIIALSSAMVLAMRPTKTETTAEQLQPLDALVHSAEPVQSEPATDPVHQPGESAPPAVHQPSALAVTSEDDPVQTAEESVHQEHETELVEPVQAPERPRLVSVHRDGAPGSVHRSKPTAKVQQRTTGAPEQSADDAPPVQPVHTAQAEAVVQAGGIDLPVAKVAAVFARKDAGQSQNEIANAKVANKRTVSKVLARREELSAADSDAEDPEPALA